MNKQFERIPVTARWVGGIALLGIVLAYQPAISQAPGFTLPYTGDAAAAGGPVVTFTNDATSGSASDGLYAFTSSTDTASLGLYGSSQGGSGVMGYANSAANTSGVYGQADGNSGYGVYGAAATSFGVYGISSGANTSGVIQAAGVYGFSATAPGVAGVSSSPTDPATYGYNNNGASGLYGQGDNGGNGVVGLTRFSVQAGVYGSNAATSGVTMGVQGQSASATGYGVVGGGAGTGVYGSTNSASNNGVLGVNQSTGGGSGVFAASNAPNGYGIYAKNSASGGYAAYLSGNVQCTGTIYGAAKSFKIDHPLDPTRKYLVHSCVESSEMLNTYSGNTTLDSDGKATVQMPDWFEAENGDFRYQLTCVGGFAPVYVEKELENNRFDIAGGKSGMKISWQVTGARQDAYAKAHPIQVEQEKIGAERGKYLNPIEYGKPAREGVNGLALKTTYPDITHKALPLLKPTFLPKPAPIAIHKRVKAASHKTVSRNVFR